MESKIVLVFELGFSEPSFEVAPPPHLHSPREEAVTLTKMVSGTERVDMTQAGSAQAEVLAQLILVSASAVPILSPCDRPSLSALWFLRSALFTLHSALLSLSVLHKTLRTKHAIYIVVDFTQKREVGVCTLL